MNEFLVFKPSISKQKNKSKRKQKIQSSGCLPHKNKLLYHFCFFRSGSYEVHIRDEKVEHVKNFGSYHLSYLSSNSA